MLRYLFFLLFVGANAWAMQQGKMAISFLLTDKESNGDMQFTCEDYVVELMKITYQEELGSQEVGTCFFSFNTHIECKCGKRLANSYNNIFKHIRKYHRNKELNKYICNLQECSKQFGRCADVLYHWEEHGLFLCCEKFMTLKNFNAHRVTCQNLLRKPRKYKNEKI